MNSQLLLLLASTYVGLLFFIAWWSESRPPLPRLLQALIYSLSLAVYCSSWTFFGAVGRTINGGWSFASIYAGPILMFVVGWPLLRRLLAACARNNVTSIADLIGSRYGKSQSLAAVVTIVAVFGALPYIALQLKAVTLAWVTVTAPSAVQADPDHQTISFVTAMLLAWFAIIFGTRVIDGPRRHRGMMAAIATESLVKLVAFAAIAIAAVGWLLQHTDLELTQIWQADAPNLDSDLIVETLLAAAAMICLPRQFHVMFVEHHSPADSRMARWFFPLYLLLFTLLILPVATAAQQFLAHSGGDADIYVLSLPMQAGSGWLTAAAYIGGVSAATGMVIVAALTLSVMISNELVVPLWLRWRGEVERETQALGMQLRRVRQFSIVIILLAAWLLEGLLGNVRGLAELGLISFAAAAQALPAIVGALYWRRGHRTGVLVGLLVGIAVWAYSLLLPMLLGHGDPMLELGPLGLSWLAPTNLFGTGALPTLTHGVLWSLALNVACFALVSRRCRFSPLDLRQADAFTRLRQSPTSQPSDFEPTQILVGQLQRVLQPLVGDVRDNRVWQEFERRLGQRLLPRDHAPRFVVEGVEESLAVIIGTTSAHRAIELLGKRKPLRLEEFASLMGNSSRQMQFGQALLQTTLETIPQGISVVDSELRLVAWNRRYEEMFQYPPRLLYVGCPIARVYHYNAVRGYMGDDIDVDHAVNRRLDLLRGGSEHRIERRMPDGRIIEVLGTPMRVGGYVTTYTDISESRRMMDELTHARDELETRVAGRTAELRSANESLIRENALRARVERELAEVYENKSQLLAAVSHDLLQPINAARLFITALQHKAEGAGQSPLRDDIIHIGSALSSAERMVGTLRDLARLDSGKLQPQFENFSVESLLDPLAREFALTLANGDVSFRYHARKLWVHSDSHLLRRIVQNFLSNAVRYTRRGRIVLGCRRRGEMLRVEVWDTGSGIDDSDQQRIFEEFERACSREDGHQGLGLGLFIANRMARLLGHRLTLRSTLGRGSMFCIEVPLGREQEQDIETQGLPVSQQLNLDVLCVDNEPSIVQATHSLLEQWGCRVVGAASLRDALVRCKSTPDIVLADYHLDDGENGLDVLQSLSLHWQRRVLGIVISADSSDELRQSVREAGYLFLAKPLKPAALRAAMRSLMRSEQSAAAQTGDGG